MCCPITPAHGEVEDLRNLLESSAILDDDDFDEEEEYEDDEVSGHYVCEDCEGCHATNEYLLECLNHVLQKCGEEEMEKQEWIDMAVTAKMQVFLYVHKIRVEMLEKEPEREKQEEDLEEDFNDLVKQLI